MKQLLLPLVDANPAIPHVWKSDNLGGGHNGEYYYKCINCKLSDWISLNGTEAQLNSDPCRPGWTK